MLPANGNVSRIRFVPNADYFGTVVLGFFAWDQTQGSSGAVWDVSQSSSRGGSKAFSNNYETANLTINPIDDAPVLATPNASIGYPLNSPSVLVASAGTVRDVDNSNYNGGWFKVVLTSGESPGDRLTIGGAFKIVNSGLIWNNTVSIGTVQFTNDDTIILVNFNADATSYRVEQLFRSIKFGTVDSNKTGPRTVGFSLNDGVLTSNPVNVTVQVS